MRASPLVCDKFCEGCRGEVCFDAAKLRILHKTTKHFRIFFLIFVHFVIFRRDFFGRFVFLSFFVISARTALSFHIFFAYACAR